MRHIWRLIQEDLVAGVILKVGENKMLYINPRFINLLTDYIVLEFTEICSVYDEN